MKRNLGEPDWEVFRRLQLLALDRFCQRVLDEIGQLTDDPNKGSHDRYQAVYRLLQNRDEQLAAAFDNPRRSTALVQLARIMAEELLTKEEFAQFSGEVRTTVEVFLDMWRGEQGAATRGPRD
jgi:hypothetical protein